MLLSLVVWGAGFKEYNDFDIILGKSLKAFG